MKLETKYLGMSTHFKYPIKSYLKIYLGVKCLETFFNTQGCFTFGAPKHRLLPPIVFVTHYTPLCWPGLFFCRWYSLWKMSFKKSRHIFVCGMMALKFPDTFTSIFNKQCLYQFYSEFKMFYFILSCICEAYYRIIQNYTVE